MSLESLLESVDASDLPEFNPIYVIAEAHTKLMRDHLNHSTPDDRIRPTVMGTLVLSNTDFSKIMVKTSEYSPGISGLPRVKLTDQFFNTASAIKNGDSTDYDATAEFETAVDKAFREKYNMPDFAARGVTCRIAGGFSIDFWRSPNGNVLKNRPILNLFFPADHNIEDFMVGFRSVGDLTWRSQDELCRVIEIGGNNNDRTTQIFALGYALRWYATSRLNTFRADDAILAAPPKRSMLEEYRLLQSQWHQRELCNYPNI